ncbi:pilus assembly protein PilM [Amphibacillus sp. MSJ-3]|uniref:pilus assembly protein PilM n=1 Tax=Amphibacillus sp. MSJ-3 TaxID=2841505 RepID=UPI001C0ED100|nr:pilus assembly protein PilM [Amphibacillus sp. MSJ-3]MBU5593691.1 pilus assembly protein PilM [Amphibacillus sp. MSJ-3]
MDNTIFTLDIGTRSVIGLLLVENDQGYKLIDYVMIEHEERSMLDGQIHDVVLVSEVIKKVKSELENRHSLHLDRVCVAAAGRALKTKRTKISKDIDQQPLMEKEDILFLELNAVQQAQYDLALEEENLNNQIHYYCVGYSVLQYQLDNELIGSLIDQQGKIAEVEIIATFLPKIVVESLLSALQRAGLEMEALTLEPIATINVLIPESMRRLNIALVDIGAGTSDIALTDQGTITAYGMVSKAGDEITEAISDHYLLDFNEAERVKRDLTEYGEATLTDILGFEETVTLDELAKAIAPAIETLAQEIADQIILLNNQAPKAVMLVGGGSLTPRLTHAIARKLKLPDNRVATRGVDAIKNLETLVKLPSGPTFITPIGIGIAAKQNPVHYISVTVNDRAVRLFDMKQLTVGDCLLAAGIHIDKMYGRPGMAYIITFNNQTITLPGTYGKAPQVILNGKEINIDHPIKHGDKLKVKKGDDGKEPIVSLKEIIDDYQSFHITFNGESDIIKPEFLVNDKRVTADYILKDHDQVRLIKIKTLADWIDNKGKQQILDDLTPFTIYLDGQKIELKQFSGQLKINGRLAELNQQVMPDDQISFSPMKQVSIIELLDALNLHSEIEINVNFNGEAVRLSKKVLTILQNNQPLKHTDLINTEAKLTTQTLENQNFIFQDLFRFISIDLSKVKGNLQILKNGKPATFLDPLTNNDQIEIKF